MLETRAARHLKIEVWKLLSCRELGWSGDHEICEYLHKWPAHMCEFQECVCMNFTSSWEVIETVCVCVFFLRLQDSDPHNCMSETIFNLKSLTSFHFGLWDQTVIWTLRGCYEQHCIHYSLSSALLKHARCLIAKLLFGRGITNHVICAKELIFANLNWYRVQV